MKFKTILAALAVSLTPGLALAMCADRHDTAMSCADGMVWDSQTRTCTAPVTG